MNLQDFAAIVADAYPHGEHEVRDISTDKVTAYACVARSIVGTVRFMAVDFYGFDWTVEIIHGNRVEAKGWGRCLPDAMAEAEAIALAKEYAYEAALSAVE
jgi:hypothetical protein